MLDKFLPCLDISFDIDLSYFLLFSGWDIPTRDYVGINLIFSMFVIRFVPLLWHVSRISSCYLLFSRYFAVSLFKPLKYDFII